MNSQFTIVETSLNRAEFRWKWLRFLQHSFLLGAILSLLALLFALGVTAGWVSSKAFAITFFAVLAVGGFVAWFIIIIAVVARAPKRPWLAAALERVDPRLLDRLNTLLFLEKRREPHAESFATQIARQTQTVLADKPAASPFPGTRPLPYLFAFLLVLGATSAVYHFYSPWQRILAAQTAELIPPASPEKPLELALPATNNVEQNANWGEVRITDPGADLKVTKVDVVPLQIEAAANQALRKVGWFSTVNGAEEAPHDLPPPAEPRYAVYQPTLYLDELRLSDWDVMTYYAKANTEKENSFASEVYFLEVRPFREDILKLPGGEGGKAYQSLNEMSALINGQQHVIRQTHQHLQRPASQENLQAQDRKKLSAAETDLGESTDHLYAKMAAEMENKPIGEALDNLALAAKSLNQAGSLLDQNVMDDARNRERKALTELIAARKIFQKALNENPKSFEEPTDEEVSPVAEGSKKLNEIAEFRNEAKAAQQLVQKTLEQQRTLEQQARRPARNDLTKLSEQERQLQKTLDEFEQQHPQVFKGTEAESQAAHEAMERAAEALQNKSKDSTNATQEASRQLEKLSQSMTGHSASQQLADAYKLKQLLDQQVRTLDQIAQGTNAISDPDLQTTANQARETVNQLKRAAEQEPTRDAFGEPLREALSGTNKVELDTRLNRLQQAQDETSKRQRSGEARDGLNNLSKAFAASEPSALQKAQQSDALKPGEQESFNVGMDELQSLIKRLENERQVSPKDQGKQGQEALFNLQTGLRSINGSNERGDQILLHLQQMLKSDRPLDVANLKKLMDELQHFSVETSDRLAKKDENAEVTNIDPTRLPPAYRGRIQKYFEKLSEK